MALRFLRFNQGLAQDPTTRRWLHLQTKWKPSVSWFKTAEFHLNHHLFHSQMQSLLLTDMAHHHLAIAFIFLVGDHMYKTNFGIGHKMKDLLDAHIPPGLALDSLGVITSLVAQHMYSLSAYAFITQDFTTQVTLYTHHQYISGFIMSRAFAHGAIFFIRDYNPKHNEDKCIGKN
ncbi:hypothetical protein RJ639_012040, partial [Escallonia herrerae]